MPKSVPIPTPTATDTVEPGDILTGEDVCELFRVNARWLERHVEAGDIVPLKAGRLNRYRRSEIVAYLERHRTVAS